MEHSEKLIGVIDWFAEDKGYGVISAHGIQSGAFLHASNWVDKSNKLSTYSDRPIVFTIKKEKGRFVAIDCRFFNNSESDCILLMQFVLHNSSPTIKSEEFGEVNIIQSALKHYNGNIKILSGAINSVVSHFDEVNILDFMKNLKLFTNSNPTIIKAIFASVSENLHSFSSDTIFLLYKSGLLNADNLTEEVIFANLSLLEVNDLNKLSDFKHLDKIYLEILASQDNDRNIIDWIIAGSKIETLIETAVNRAAFFNFDYADKKLTENIDLLLTQFDKNSDVHESIKSRLSLGSLSPGQVLKLLSYKILEADEIGDEFFKTNISNINIEIFDILEDSGFIERNPRSIYQFLSSNSDAELLRHLILSLDKYVSFEDKNILIESFAQGILKYPAELQAKFLRKLFHLKVSGKIDFSKEDLKSLLGDINSIENLFLIDPSTYLIINILLEFLNNHQFYSSNSKLIKLVLKLSSESNRRIRFLDFFDQCSGRTRLTMDPSGSTVGEIVREHFNKGGFKRSYFKISLFVSDEGLVADLSKIPGIRVNSKEGFWGVPESQEEDVISFAQDHKMYLNFQANGESLRSRCELNSHLLTKNKSRPSEGYLCDGYESNKLDNLSNKAFWWCLGSPCYESNIKLHDATDWEQFTLYDFIKIFGKEEYLQEANRRNKFKIGKYTQLVSLVNRFNALLERLYCLDCGNILYPVETSYFAANNVTKFSCASNSCEKKGIEVYLNRCLNGDCSNVIDSRVHKKCPNGLFICNICGSCCSTESFKRRLERLEDMSNSIPQDLPKFVQEKSGHLEKAEYYCSKCDGPRMMEEVRSDLFKCTACGLEYDLSMFNRILKRHIYKDMRTKSYPSLNAGLSKEDEKKLIQLLISKKIEFQDKGYATRRIFGIIFNMEVEINGLLLSLKSINNKRITNQVFD